jgi:hypothetical protein
MDIAQMLIVREINLIGRFPPDVDLIFIEWQFNDIFDIGPFDYPQRDLIWICHVGLKLV